MQHGLSYSAIAICGTDIGHAAAMSSTDIGYAALHSLPPELTDLICTDGTRSRGWLLAWTTLATPASSTRCDPEPCDPSTEKLTLREQVLQCLVATPTLINLINSPHSHTARLAKLHPNQKDFYATLESFFVSMSDGNRVCSRRPIRLRASLDSVCGTDSGLWRYQGSMAPNAFIKVLPLSSYALATNCPVLN